MSTNELIAQLSQEASKKRLGAPRTHAMRLGLVLVVYGLGLQLFLGVRPDSAMQLMRPFFLLETLLLVALIITSTGAAILAMYPDHYQRPALLKLPYAVFGSLLAFLLLQLLMPHDARMVVPSAEEAHGMECALCIGSVTLIPSALIFGLLRKGASITPLRAGSFAVLAASGLGCLTLRLAEMNDSLIHLVQWHYIPTFLFALLGAWVGKFLLRW